MNIVPLDAACAYRDIPRQLREMADKIDAGEHPDLRFVMAVLVGPNAGVDLYGWGDYTTLEGFGALARAMALR
jgi:hypothetical protein